MNETATAPLRIGLVGLGRHGRRYADHLRGDVCGARLAAVCRRNLAEARAFAASYGVEVFEDYRALCASPEVDAVLIATPVTSHAEIAVEALRRGKAVLVEKPMAASVAECDAIVAAARETGAPLMVAQTQRADRTARALRAWIEAHRPLRTLHLTYRLEPYAALGLASRPGREGAVLFDLAVHLFDAARHFTGAECRRVDCRAAFGPSPMESAYVHALLEMSDGTLATVEASRLGASRIARLEAVAEGGQAVADPYGGTLATYRGRIGTPAPVPDGPPALVAIVEEFAAAVRARSAPPITGADGRAAVEIAEACERSVRERRPVEIGRPRN